MKGVKDCASEVVRMVEGPGHYFLGYYDVPVWSADDRCHLCHRTTFHDRYPLSGETTEIGIVDLETKAFRPVDSTSTWNFQQGSMLQWLPRSKSEEIIFNWREGEHHRAVIRNVANGDRRVLDKPIANVDSKGQAALHISFSRLYDFRPVCGYAGSRDPFREDNHPEDDGIFLMDLADGSSRMILSLHDIWRLSEDNPRVADKKLVINHITFNPAATRFLFLVRTVLVPGKKWETAVYTANRDGTDVYRLIDYSYASHYNWLDDDHVLFYARGPRGDQLYLMRDKCDGGEIVDPEFFKTDGHCSYSPNKEWILYDSYPDAESYRSLCVYNVAKRKGISLGRFYSDPRIDDDIRCDLHPRWNHAGNCVTFDSIHEGSRCLYTMNVGDLLEAER